MGHRGFRTEQLVEKIVDTQGIASLQLGGVKRLPLESDWFYRIL